MSLSVLLRPLLSIALSWGVLVGGGAVSSAASTIPSAYVAAYRFSEDKAELEALHKELDRVADKFNFVIREIARKKLHKNIRPYDRLILHRADTGVVSLRLGDRPSLPCDGLPHAVKSNGGESGTSVCSYDHGRIRVESKYDDAVNVIVLTRGSAQEPLRMQVILKSERLPDTVRYALTYFQN